MRNANTITRQRLAVLTILLIGFVGLFKWGDLVRLAKFNWASMTINRAWLGMTYHGPRRDGLQDGIPDAWNTQWWNGATPVYTLELHSALEDQHAIRIQNSNTQGVVALIQDIIVTPNSQLVCTVYAKGMGGAIQFRFRSQGTDKWIAKGWLDIGPSEKWQQHRLLVTVPPNKDEARLFLRTTSSNWFDRVYVGVREGQNQGPNLLHNSSFEQDGILEKPLEWWGSYIASPGAPAVQRDNLSNRVVLLNIIDMLSGRYNVIKRRTQLLENRCASVPEMTSWLIAQGRRFEQAGGPAARERVYQLAIELAPNCPQPYAALAELYSSHRAFWYAADLYHHAAELSGKTARAGKYYFEEGFLHVRYTGDMASAVLALQQAEQLSGWEGSHWDWGVAPLYLGWAMEAEGRFEEAAAAYQRVIDCQQCKYHHTAARNSLEKLSIKHNQ